MDSYLERAIRSLEEKKWDAWYRHLKRPIEMMKLEFKLLKMFVWGSAYYWEYDWYFRFTIGVMFSTLNQIEEEFVADCINVEGFDLEASLYNLEKMIDELQLKQHAKDVCILTLGGAYRCMYYPPKQKDILIEYGREISSFLNLILENLGELQKSNMMAPVMKQQIALLKGKLEEFGMHVDYINPSILKVKKMYELMSCAGTWLGHISCLTYLYWSDGKDESMASTMEVMLYGLLHKTKIFSTSGVISSYSQPTLIPQLLARHLDFILEDLALHLEDDIEALQEGLIFMFSFIMDQPQDDLADRETLFTHIYVVINEFSSLTHSICSGRILEGGFCKAVFTDYLLQVHTAMEKVKNLYLVIPNSVQFRAPNTNVTQPLYSLIKNQKKMLEKQVNLIPSLMHQCELLLKELTSLSPLLENMVELQGGEQDEIIAAVYNADYVIKVTLLRNCSAWYGVIALPHVVEQIRSGVVKLSSKKWFSQDDQLVGTYALKPQGTTSKIEYDCVGFIEDERVMMDELRRGLKSLTIVSISGSGGQGKTTFAKRIYNDSNVQCHFQKRVWCYISKDCPIKYILQHILCDTEDNVHNKLDTQDLIERVRKSLKGRRYLIVLDDIWDIYSWGKLESSFPDDRNGSRILLTTRNHDLASQVKSNSISHPLPLFSDEGSWELLKKRVFGLDICDENLVKIGKEIASYCEGLPLAVTLIAAILARAKPSLELWIEVARNLKAHLASEGCGKVIELSYKCLPDHLKSCFLYFGAFQRGGNVSAEELKLLWIGEGFIIQDGKAKSRDKDLATKYLNDLVSQSLVVVTEWSSVDEIKMCNVHDLVYDMCLDKCKEENFLNWVDVSVVVGDGDDISDTKDGTTYSISPEDSVVVGDHRLQIGATDPFIKSSPIVTKWELPTSTLHSFLCSKCKSSLQILGSFKILTVLKLELGVTDEIPLVILSCLHLRYLALHFMSGITAVQPEIAKLQELETLIIDWYSPFVFRYSMCTSLPVSLWNIKNLRHLQIRYAFSESEDFDLKNSSMLNTERVGKLRLHGDDSTTVDILQRFPNLRKLSCDISRRRRNNILEWLSLVGCLLTQLQSLKVDYTESVVADRYPYEGNPNPDISNLLEIGNLKKLTLDTIEIPWSVLSKIGKLLPNLEALKLRFLSCKGGSWNLEDGDFSKLMYLKLKSLKIEEIDVSSCEDSPPFPCLEHLVVRYCTKLQGIPLVFGEICNLRKIHVVGCNAKVTSSVMKIVDEQKDFGNHSLQVMVEHEYEDDDDRDMDKDTDAAPACAIQ